MPRKNLEGLRQLSLEANLITTSVTAKEIIDKEKEQNVIEWITFFRRNLEIYVEEILQIKLKPFQRPLIHLMGISDYFMNICSRGIGKNFCLI